MLPSTQKKQSDFKIIFKSRDDGLSQELVLPGEHQHFLKELKLEDLKDVTEDGTFHLEFEDSETRSRWAKVFENSYLAKKHNAKVSAPFKLEDNEQ